MLMSSAAADQPPVPADPDVSLRANTKDELTEMNETAGYCVHDEAQVGATLRSISNPGLPETPTRTTPLLNTASSHQDYPRAESFRTAPMLDSNAQSSALQAWMDAIPEIASQRDLILTERMEVTEERKLLYQREDYFIHTADHLSSLIESSSQDSPASTHRDDIKACLTNMRTSRQDLEQSRERISELEKRLSSHEYTLTKLERKTYEDIDSCGQKGLLQQTLTTSQLPIQEEREVERPLQSNNTTSHDLRENLYSRMADLRILLDRLHDFEGYLRNELDERDILRATGQVSLSTDTEFFEGARIERAKLQTEFEKAQVDVEGLKRLCMQQGVGFQDVQFEDPFHRETFYDDTYSNPSTQEEAATLPLPESPPGILGTFFATRERVKNWLKDPSNSEILITSGAERAPEGKKRQGSRSDAGWVIPRERCSWPGRGRPASVTSSIGNEEQYGIPVQVSGPTGKPERLESLLKDSMEDLDRIYADRKD